MAQRHRVAATWPRWSNDRSNASGPLARSVKPSHPERYQMRLARPARGLRFFIGFYLLACRQVAFGSVYVDHSGFSFTTPTAGFLSRPALTPQSSPWFVMVFRIT